MANNLRDLRRKMKAIKSTRQVTKAMELVSASKMRKAVQNAQILRRYALTAWTILRRVAHVQRGSHPFLMNRPLKRILCILITSDRGLCGSLNTHILRTASQYVQSVSSLGSDVQTDFIAVGKKGHQFLGRSGASVIAAFPAYSNRPSFRDVLPVSKMVIDAFIEGKYDRVVLVYSDFISALIQEPVVKVLLPFSESELQSMVQSMLPSRRMNKEEQIALDAPLPKTEYLFEPSPAEVLNRILPQLTELQIYQAILENAASEHSARMVAMRNASDNASDIIQDLTLTYNQTRQSIITAELAELSASKAALD
jgi:F-type H+-transporting ATPase subunit gamma